MKVFLGNIPWYKDGLYGVRAGSRWPHFQQLAATDKLPFYMPFPFFLSYATAILEEVPGVEVLLLDGVAEALSVEGFIESISQFEADILFFETSTPTINYDLEFIKTLRAQIGSSVKIVLGGPHSEMFKKEFLERNTHVDYVIKGEYEFTLKSLTLALKEGDDISGVKGLLYKDAGNKICENEGRELISDIDTLPLPSRHFLPMENYRDSFCGLAEPSLQLWGSRGCPFGCIFCFWPQVMYNGRNYRPRSAKKIVDELEIVLKQYNYKSFYFDDDTFNIGKERIMEICAEIKRRNINLPWGVMARADLMDEELLDALKDAGLYAVKYGMESVDQKLVDNSGKNLDLQKARDVVAYTRKLGIKVHLTFSFGLPGETKETIKKTIAQIIELNPDNVQFSIITPFPGSTYFNELKEKNLIFSYNWDDYNGSVSSVFRTENLTSSDLDDALETAKNMWNKRYHLNNKLQKVFFEKVKDNVKSILDNKINDIRKILVFRSSFVEHAKSSIIALKEIFPLAKIDMVVQKDMADEFLDSGINLIQYPASAFSDDSETNDFISALKTTNYDLNTVLYNNPLKYGYNIVNKLANSVSAKNNLGIFVEGEVTENF